MQTGMRRFVRDVGFSFASLAISALVHFALRVFLGRYMGEGDLGLYTLSFTVYSIGIVFGAFGIGAALTKYVAEYREDASRTNVLLTNGIMGPPTRRRRPLASFPKTIILGESRGRSILHKRPTLGLL